MRNKLIHRILEIKTFFIIVLIIVSLSYFGIKYYTQGELLFNQYQFKFYIAFFLLFLWMAGYQIYQNKELKEGQRTILDLIRFMIDENVVNHDNIVKLHQNTRKIILESLDEGVDN